MPHGQSRRLPPGPLQACLPDALQVFQDARRFLRGRRSAAYAAIGGARRSDPVPGVDFAALEARRHDGSAGTVNVERQRTRVVLCDLGEAWKRVVDLLQRFTMGFRGENGWRLHRAGIARFRIVDRDDRRRSRRAVLRSGTERSRGAAATQQGRCRKGARDCPGSQFQWSSSIPQASNADGIERN